MTTPTNSTTPLERSELKSQTGIALDWTREEQAILDDGLATYSLHSIVSRYTRISLDLPNKTARDVAMRCIWNNGLRRVKVENSNSVPQDAITNELLAENEHLFFQISANLTSSKLVENLSLFNKVRENMTKLVNDSNENVSEPMTHMPPLPEEVNDELFELIFSLLNLPNIP
ncbi:unnamed protein product [Thlaspi arvense]|uniref:Uncharacterized protein n=1 Tax=Thlaspi arvense TaxID=13288 RepID=A0AAU9T1I3_THLAR|nr:unnamed protein product [Thlaspi arvense]